MDPAALRKTGENAGAESRHGELLKHCTGAQILSREGAGVETGPLAVDGGEQQPALRSQHAPDFGKKSGWARKVIDSFKQQDDIEAGGLIRKLQRVHRSDADL